MKLQIIPGESVGKYKLGMTYHKLIKTIQLENIAYKEIVVARHAKSEKRKNAE